MGEMNTVRWEVLGKAVAVFKKKALGVCNHLRWHPMVTQCWGRMPPADFQSAYFNSVHLHRNVSYIRVLSFGVFSHVLLFAYLRCRITPDDCWNIRTHLKNGFCFVTHVTVYTRAAGLSESFILLLLSQQLSVWFLNTHYSCGREM